MLAGLPEDDERDRRELELQLLLGICHLMTKGHGASEVGSSYHRAHELSSRIGETGSWIRSVFGLWRHNIVVPNFAYCHDLARQLGEMGDETNDPVTRVLAHYASGVPNLLSGELIRAREAFDAGLELYDPGQRDSLDQGQDPKEACLAYRGITLWLLGYPDAARRSATDGITYARDIADPFSEAHANYFHAMLDHISKDRAALQVHSDEAVRLSQEHGFSTVSSAGGQLYQRWLDATGDVPGAFELLRNHMKGWVETGFGALGPIRCIMLAEASAATGRFDLARDDLAAGREITMATHECWYEAELHRLQGQYDRTTDEGGGSEAEAAFERAIDVARRQEARSLELRASSSLARLWQSQSKTAEARDLLAPVYGWFTEGFDTADLKEAKALLDELN